MVNKASCDIQSLLHLQCTTPPWHS